MIDDHDRRYALEYRADFAEDARIRYWAEMAGVSPQEWLLKQLARAVRGWSAPPARGGPEPQAARRARRRAESPDGMSAHTREIQILTTDRSTTP